MLLAQLVVSVVSASASAPPFLLYENADNAHGRWNASGGATFLGGGFASAAACEKACVAKHGADPTSGCTAFTHYTAGHYRAELREQCYCDMGGAWAPFYSSLGAPAQWGNVTSGQNAPSAFVTKCAGPADCSYNGECAAGVCRCHPQWMGKYCGQLHTVPTPRGAGLQSTDGGGLVSSWGGSVVRGDDGKYHMCASRRALGRSTWQAQSSGHGLAHASMNVSD
jgi:hypothetical protein